MTNKEKYIRFCEQNDFVPIFSQPWWMDAVCIDGYWDVLLYEKADEILGALPYFVKKKIGLSYITQPPFTQNNGVIIKYPENQKYEKRLSHEKEVMTALIEQLEKLPISFYRQQFNCNYTNWLPFYWKGYKQTTYYTYAYKNILNIQEQDLLKSYSQDKRKSVQSGKSKGLYLSEDISVDDFYEFHKLCLIKLGKQISYSHELLVNMVNGAYERNMGKVFTVRDVEGSLVAVRFAVWDKYAGYGINTAICHTNRDGGPFVFHEVIKYISNFVNIFYLGGSMIESVEASYRRFGTVQVPYFVISKIMTKNPFFHLLIDKRLK
ncbi:hypothetical protein [Sanguibacteroides justesenii]|uniref:hypothetical protein n=1 Tax=Sanguibacteroides justesenii TaxID=1547597 RepID=UPI0006976BAD|nr:hypothetical protein [Sanguibacteroides justesenii]